MTLHSGSVDPASLYVGATPVDAVYDGPTLVWAPPAADVLFPFPDADTVSTASDPNSSLSVGERITPTVTGLQLLGVRAFVNGERMVTPFLCDPDGSVIATGSAVAAAGGWQRMLFAAPVPLTQGQDYFLGYFQSGSAAYGYVAGGLSTDQSGAGLTILTGSGRFKYDAAGPFLAEVEGATQTWFTVQAILAA